jgi:hypothetical protein
MSHVFQWLECSKNKVKPKMLKTGEKIIISLGPIEHARSTCPRVAIVSSIVPDSFYFGYILVSDVFHQGGSTFRSVA